jgi:hypothetical protein
MSNGVLDPSHAILASSNDFGDDHYLSQYRYTKKSGCYGLWRFEDIISGVVFVYFTSENEIE